MGRGKHKRTRIRFSTPPPGLCAEAIGLQIQTPTRCGILGAALHCSSHSLQSTVPDIAETFQTSIRTTERIISEARCRRPGNSMKDENRPQNHRHQPLKFTAQDATAVSTYLDSHPEDQTKSWNELAYRAGTPYKLSQRVIQFRCQEVEELGTFTAADKALLPPHIVDERREWCEYWKNHWPRRKVVFCDELHWGTGPQGSKKIKRRLGERYKEQNINYQRDFKKRKKAEDSQQPFSNFHTFCILGYNFKRLYHYEVPNKVGKMTTPVYLQLLKHLLEDEEFRERELILYQDQDSAHTSQTTDAWMKRNSLKFITGPSKSPDLSVMETWASPLKHYFYQRRTVSISAGQKRAEKIFNELDQEKINQNIDFYRKRLFDCFSLDGRMTKY